MDKSEFANQIIDALGGTNAVARLFNIKPPSVSGWREDGIPDARLMYIKVAHPEVFSTPNQTKAEA
ncbi:hypothetical protein [Nitrosospira briensis]|uniref:hypothetical protein n=1 Tax=Nitrosospira briensis TaxID=35799 RepID=UPI000469A3EC|nr:hypothetical protein [Nitrosospira briensis]